MEETDAWPIPVPAHPGTLSSGKQISGIFTSLKISHRHRMKDGIGGRPKYVETMVEIQHQQPEFHIVLEA